MRIPYRFPLTRRPRDTRGRPRRRTRRGAFGGSALLGAPLAMRAQAWPAKPIRLVIGFAGGSHAGSGLAAQLRAAGARTAITDMRALKGAIIDLRGW